MKNGASSGRLKELTQKLTIRQLALIRGDFLYQQAAVRLKSCTK
jgi:hypothetical protein